MGSYISTTVNEHEAMLKAIGAGNVRELFSAVPQKMIINKLNMPVGMSELEVYRRLEETAAANTVFKSIFRGAGAYDHYIPSAVKAISSKEEFVTAYTPYQAEISQGVLQTIFEYQTMICELTGMDSSNASVYDGASAAAEAIAMCRDKKRNRAVICKNIKPDVMEVIKTYCMGSGVELSFVGIKDGHADMESLKELVNEETACIYIEQPNYYGLLEDADTIAEIAHNAKAKLIMGCNPISLGLLRTPAECGADIAVGEGQPLGISLGFGGPYLGFMTCKGELTRKLPGRIVGETTDSNGNRAFVLTLQAREQHIRREKASSNICSNEALCALKAAVYMSVMGPGGIRQAALLSTSKAHYLAEQLECAGLKLKYQGEFFNEFVTEGAGITEKLMDALEEKGILGGLPLEDGCILWCATEKNSRDDIDKVIQTVKEVL